MKCGNLLFDAKFQFRNGNIDYKLIIVVCDYGTDCLVLQTTRQPKAKNRVSGCQIGDKPPNFYVPKGSAWFDDDTWILLDEVFEYNADQYFYKKEDGVVQHRHNLSDSFMKSLMECLLQSRDIDGFDKDFIKKAYNAL